MPELRICKWHRCKKGKRRSRAPFIPERSTQEFCSAECRLARLEWKRQRGAVIVDPLIDGDRKKIEEIRKNLKREVSE